MHRYNFNNLSYLVCFDDCGSLPIRALTISVNMAQGTHFRDLEVKIDFIPNESLIRNIFSKFNELYSTEPSTLRCSQLNREKLSYVKHHLS